MIYQTPRAMTVDQACREIYGDESGYVEAVFAANPGLASRGLILPAGTTLDAPVIEGQGESVPVVTLWD